MYTYIYIYMCVCVRVFVYVCVYVCVCVFVCMSNKIHYLNSTCEIHVAKNYILLVRVT